MDKKELKTFTLRLAEPERDFGQLAAWFTLLEDSTNTEQGLRDYYEKHNGRITQRVIQDEQGQLLGFYWAARDRLRPELTTLSLFVRPEQRQQGIGRQLYAHLEQALDPAQVRQLRVGVWDNCPEGRAFAERRGFIERAHSFAMTLDLQAFDDRPYEAVITRLQSEGFLFTSLGALGNTEEAQRRLYVLNETTGMDTPGTDGAPSWASFDDFQQSVCQRDWYRPDGQMVVIDTNTGEWAAMSAISRFDDYAYNLHTGVDKRYRGRKLAQAVKVQALRYARQALGVSTVRTHHNAKNLPMIAIDRKFGYVQAPGIFLMEKMLA
ncbi:MAG: GNAT family N-acetyltransferase [Anaerolineales bacterium]|nr:GNAT family N-acetyltransferase [Anaerolineales bacterium]